MSQACGVYRRNTSRNSFHTKCRLFRWDGRLVRVGLGWLFKFVCWISILINKVGLCFEPKKWAFNTWEISWGEKNTQKMGNLKNVEILENSIIFPSFRNLKKFVKFGNLKIFWKIRKSWNIGKFRNFGKFDNFSVLEIRKFGEIRKIWKLEEIFKIWTFQNF